MSTSDDRARLPEKGESWERLQVRLQAMGSEDVDWRHARTAVYVFNAGEDVLPFCPFVNHFIDTHPEYRELVPEDMRERFGL